MTPPNVNQLVTQAVITPRENLDSNSLPLRIALFDEEGNPVDPTAAAVALASFETATNIQLEAIQARLEALETP